MLIRSALLAAVTIVPSTAAFAQAQDHLANAPYIWSQAPRGMNLADRQFLDQLKTFRQEGLILRQSDGGTLTPEHRAQLQARLDRLNADHCRNVTKHDPCALDPSCIKDRAD
jgi:hypothetical protein